MIVSTLCLVLCVFPQLLAKKHKAHEKSKSGPKYCILMPVGGWDCSNQNNPNQVYPINSASNLIWNYGQIYDNAQVLTIFYGGGKYWDSSTTSLLANAISYLPESSYMEPVLSLLKQQNAKASFSMKNSITYYGVDSLHDQAAQSEIVTAMVKKFVTNFNNAAILIILDPEYSRPSNFKLNEYIAYDLVGGGFCGYHSAISFEHEKNLVQTSTPIPFGYVGTNGSSCQWKLGSNLQVPNPGWIDITLSVYTHELSEILSDPFGSGYLDNMNLENGDKCAGYPGGFTNIGTTNYIYNVILGTNHFLLQAQYDFLTNTCPPIVYDN
jgi:hypothetical protein